MQNEAHLGNDTLLRFCEYTHKITNGFLMVVDLQGVLRDNTYWLTDPVILCRDIRRFGPSNLGPVFIVRCINSVKLWLARISPICGQRSKLPSAGLAMPAAPGVGSRGGAGRSGGLGASGFKMTK